MGINHYFSNYSGFFYFIYVILAYLTFPVCTTTPFAKSCGLYGAPPCRYLPAPPGQTPSCARPGKTYCEYVDNYPIYLVKHLVQKWGYEAKNLLVDETLDNFAADTPVFYDPAYIFPQRNSNHGTDLNGYNYERPPYESRRNSENINYNTDTYRYPKSPTTEVPKYLLYASSSNLNKSKFSSFGSSTVKSTPNNPTLWLQRFVRELAKKSSLSYDENPRLVIDATVESVGKYSTNSSSIRNVPFNIDTSTSSRAKRQSPGRTTLCQTTFQFITPQAALNSQGNWMFVVNEVNTARQTVKAELCASNTCTNLCQLPNGYNSKCEQKFVQKRLIALQGSGQNLYTDTFWFPSCCVCTISAN